MSRKNTIYLRETAETDAKLSGGEVREARPEARGSWEKSGYRQRLKTTPQSYRH
jgi:hypothetical protein